VAQRARAALAREAVRREQLAAAPAEPVAPSVEAPREEAAAPPPAEAYLSLRADVEGEGRVLLRDGERLLFDHGYEFVERVGVFRRRQPRAGVVGFQRMKLGPGLHELHFSVQPAGRARASGSVEVDLPPGGALTLRLTLGEGGQLRYDVVGG
jgi:hypothetical protein